LTAPADAISEYNAIVLGAGAAAAREAARFADALKAAGVTFAGESMPSFLRPHLVERRAWRDLHESGRRVLELAVALARRVFDGDARRLAEFLGMPPEEAAWAALDPGPPDVLLSRLDAFATPDGPRFIEINSDAPAGFGYGDRMAEVFAGTAAFQAFAQRWAVSYQPSSPALVETLRSACAARTGVEQPTVAIVDWADVKTRADQEILREAFERAGLPALLADPRELELGGGRLLAGASAVDVVYRRALLPELLERRAESEALFEAYRSGAAYFVNSFRCRLSEDKAFFAILTDEAFADYLAAADRDLLARVLPWTRRLEERRTLKAGLEVDLVPFVLRSREQLVLKPAHGYGGQSVLVGSETAASAWESAVAAAVGGAWVVQERVPIPEEPFPVFENGELRLERLKVNVNPFYAGGAEVGAVTRASRSSVINVGAGGGSVPTFVVG
jgi:hypothetical protein